MDTVLVILSKVSMTWLSFLVNWVNVRKSDLNIVVNLLINTFILGRVKRPNFQI